MPPMLPDSITYRCLYNCHGRGRGFEPRRPRHKPNIMGGLRLTNCDSTTVYGTGRYGTVSDRYDTAINISTCLLLALRFSAETACV